MALRHCLIGRVVLERVTSGNFECLINAATRRYAVTFSRLPTFCGELEILGSRSDLLHIAGIGALFGKRLTTYIVRSAPLEVSSCRARRRAAYCRISLRPIGLVADDRHRKRRRQAAARDDVVQERPSHRCRNTGSAGSTSVALSSSPGVAFGSREP